MPQIVGIELEAQVVVGVHHLMRHGILHVAAVPELVRAQQDAVLWVEAAALRGSAAPAPHVLGVQIVAQQVDVVAHEADDGRVLQEPGFVLVAAGAVVFLVQVVLDFEVGFSLLVAGRAAQYAEESRPGVIVLVENGRGGSACRVRKTADVFLGHVCDSGGESCELAVLVTCTGNAAQIDVTVFLDQGRRSIMSMVLCVIMLIQ